MALSSYKEINREITIKNQELKAEIAAKNAEINKKDLAIMYYQKELKRCKEDNEKFRLIVMEVIQKTTIEYNRLILSLSNTNQEVNSSTQKLVNDANQNSQLLSNIRHDKSYRNRSTADDGGTGSSFEEPSINFALRQKKNDVEDLNYSEGNISLRKNRLHSPNSTTSNDFCSDKENKNDNLPNIEKHGKDLF